MQILDQPLEFQVLPGALNAVRARTDEAGLLSFARIVKASGGRFVSLWGSDDRDLGRGFTLHVAFGLTDGLALVSLPLSSERPEYPDLAEVFPPANRLQRATFDLLGLPA